MGSPPFIPKETGRSSTVRNALKILLALVLGAFVLSRMDRGELLALRGRIIPLWLAAVFVNTPLQLISYVPVPVFAGLGG